MIPRNLSRHIILAVCLGFIAVGFAVPVRTENVPGPQGANHIFTKAFCSSEQDKPVVYFSKIFDVDITVPTIDTQPLVNGFIIHLKEKYDYQTSSNYPVVCPLYKTLAEAEATKRKMQGQVQQAAQQIIEVDWIPPAWAQPLQSPGGPGFFPQAPPQPTHTYCALGNADTMYFSAVFDTVGALNNQAWNDAFVEFLRKTYGFEAEVEPTCTIMNTVREAERNLTARIGGIRANRHKAVETGWKFGPNAVATRPRPKPTPKVDDDPEPAPQRPAAPTPSADTRDFAAKEGSAALTLCQNDRVMSGAFDCYCIHREVYNYRMAHASEAGQGEPLAALFAKDKLNCEGCIAPFANFWATSYAQSQRLTADVADCVSKRFVTSLHAKPYPSHAKELINGAIAACRK